MKKNKKLSLTFDVDMTDYRNNIFIDEFHHFFQRIQNTLKEFKEIKTTWFLRIDKQIDRVSGVNEYIFTKNKKNIDWLVNNGHEVALHFHSYEFNNGLWVQSLNEGLICDELYRSALRGVEFGLKGIRMGWGYHTNNTMKMISELGYKYDSSAIPRPVYDFELSTRDWSLTSSNIYNPSISDYRVPGDLNHKIIEIPMSTVPISAPTDTVEMIRTINPVYETSIFLDSLTKVKTDFCVIMTHPVELSFTKADHPLYSNNYNSFEINMRRLVDMGIDFATMEMIAHQFSTKNEM